MVEVGKKFACLFTHRKCALDNTVHAYANVSRQRAHHVLSRDTGKGINLLFLPRIPTRSTCTIYCQEPITRSVQLSY